MKMTPYDAWAFARLLAGYSLGAALEFVSKGFAALAERLDGMAPEDRDQAWNVALSLRETDREAFTLQVVGADPESPPPKVEVPARPANLGDIRRVMSQEQWLWEGWIPKSRISGISAAEGVGKTRMAMDLARRIWHGLPWPDGQPATLPPGTPTLWICSDGQQDDLAMNAGPLGLPDHAIHFNTLPEDPYGGTNIDDDESLDQLEKFIHLIRPGLVFIDSLTFATSRDLCVANHVMGLMTPVRDISQQTQTTIIPLLHVSKDGQALGKRIKGIARTIIQLECFSPENPTRLRMSVSKTFAKKPPALGVTLTDRGNDYDSNPPSAPPPGQVGRPSTARNEAADFILAALRAQNGLLGTELRGRWEGEGKSRNTFNRAVEELIKSGTITESGGTGQGSLWTLSLMNRETLGETAF